MASYANEVAKIRRQFSMALKRAKTRQAILNAYWIQKRQHERLLKRHLRREFIETRKQIKKINAGGTIPPRGK